MNFKKYLEDKSNRQEIIKLLLNYHYDDVLSNLDDSDIEDEFQNRGIESFDYDIKEVPTSKLTTEIEKRGWVVFGASGIKDIRDELLLSNPPAPSNRLEKLLFGLLDIK